MKYAHTLPEKPPSEWQTMPQHEEGVSQFAADFVEAFTSRDWGKCLGLWHDFGKYQIAFQDYLKKENGLEAHLETSGGRTPHSTAGALLARKMFPDWKGDVLAYIILGHHAGLPDYSFSNRSGSTNASTLKGRLAEEKHYPEEVSKHLLQAFELVNPSMRDDITAEWECAFAVAFFTRMLFSALVDADRLDTQRFCEPDAFRVRTQPRPSLTDMREELNAMLAAKAASAEDTEVNRQRARILADCREKAKSPPGLFSLTVPTGGGKTLSSLAFALDHVAAHPRHKFQRVIYAIPFTSIIEQNAQVFRDVFQGLSGESVLEYHSNLDPEKVEENWQSRLNTENWDAPLIVTTTVQFYESLFAAHTGRCRKLHNIANSIIILDEVQTLPVEYLDLCLCVLKELAANYGCTIVLCTATPPALTAGEYFPRGFKEGTVREIIEKPDELYNTLKRVKVSNLGVLGNEELLSRLAEEEQVLCVVNTKAHASELVAGLEGQGVEGVYHLSAAMCPEHRKRVMSEFRQRLKEGESCRLISTQLIEAGVDVDFPVVYRSLAGIDSIAQSAGRCNREGKREKGQVFVFTPEDKKYLGGGYLKQTGEAASGVLEKYSDVLSLQAVEEYFIRHYQTQSSGEGSWDKKNIREMAKMTDRPMIQFREIEKSFKLIGDDQVSIIVPYGEDGRMICEAISKEFPPPDIALIRRAQRYSVNVYRTKLAQLRPHLSICHERFYVLVNESLYDETRGLLLQNAGEAWEPENLIS